MLGRRLKALRERAQMTTVQAAAASDLQQSTISRAESANIVLHATSLRVLLQTYGATEGEQAWLMALHRSAKEAAFWYPYRSALTGEWLRLFVDTEAEATHASTYEGPLIPGLLQTRDYMTSMFTAAFPQDQPPEADNRVKLRLERQDRLLAGDMSLRAVVDHVALQRRIAPAAVMVEQIQHLRDVAKLRNVTVQVLPLTSAVAITTPFIVLDFPVQDDRFPADPSMVYVEHQTGALFLESEDDVRSYARAFGELQAAACSPDDTDALLAQASATIKGALPDDHQQR